MVIVTKEDKANRKGCENAMKCATPEKTSAGMFMEEMTFKKRQDASEVADQVVVIETSFKAEEIASAKWQSLKHLHLLRNNGESE